MLVKWCIVVVKYGKLEWADFNLIEWPDKFDLCAPKDFRDSPDPDGYPKRKKAQSEGSNSHPWSARGFTKRWHWLLS